MSLEEEGLPGGVWLGVGLEVGEENREGTLREKAVVRHSLGTEALQVECWGESGQRRIWSRRGLGYLPFSLLAPSAEPSCSA